MGTEYCWYATPDWPDSAWPGRIERVTGARSPTAFARRLNEMGAQYANDTLFSLERIWACDVYRAGDGVHAAWLERRARFEPAWRSWLRGWSGKHRELLALETALFRDGGTHRVIANSRLVADEIVWRFGFPRDYIDIVYNGGPRPATGPKRAVKCARRTRSRGVRLRGRLRRLRLGEEGPALCHRSRAANSRRDAARRRSRQIARPAHMRSRPPISARAATCPACSPPPMSSSSPTLYDRFLQRLVSKRWPARPPRHHHRAAKSDFA